MIDFQITKQSRHSRARLGVLKTPHGEIETPAFVPVATQGAVKALTTAQVLETKTNILIANTFHLHLRPGENTVAAGGGLHKFMRWPKPLMTDSGGFQVFSLGFGKDLGTTKILKTAGKHSVRPGAQPKLLKIEARGVTFRSPIDGEKLFLGPQESMAIQAKLGADIIFAFDECPPPQATHAYHQEALGRTHPWANLSLRWRKSGQALYGIVQGGRYRDLRAKSAKFIGDLPFEGFGIGGEFGSDKTAMAKMLTGTIDALPHGKPRHLLGIGYLEDIPKIIRAGVDTFDCIVPTHYARRGIAFTSRGELDLKRSSFLKDRRPLDPSCKCGTCALHTRSYLSHLLRAHEITPLTLLTFHNIFFFNSFVEKIRKAIRASKF